ncbi:MAG: hypothetical protein SFZ02_03550 [bacterium]|nr:hypothetical protein [bacterium]
MTPIRDIHRQAMEIADEAFMAKRLGELDRAKSLFLQSFELELSIAQQATTEPSRSVLLRSAATLALHAEHYREAERVAAMGLSGNPPSEIADELRDVLGKSNFYRQLSMQISEQVPNEQVAFEGQLLYVDAFKDNKIKILDESGKKHTITVSDTIAEEIVRIYFGKKVIIHAIRNQKKLLLRDIHLVSE